LLIDIIIVNYRTSDLTLNCLFSMYKQRHRFNDFKVYIVDNKSNDGSVKFLNQNIEANKWNDWVSVLEMPSNHGFSSGNNAAIKHIFASGDLPKYLMLLNPDTLVKEKSIENLAEFLNNWSNVGIVGAQLQNSQCADEISARRFPTIISEFLHGARLSYLTTIFKKWDVNLSIKKYPFPCDWVSGAAMMIRREVFEEIGFFDVGFFLYFEETDFCRRAIINGWQVWLNPLSLVVHLEGQSTKILRRSKRRGHYWFESRKRFFIKHYGIIYFVFTDILWAIGYFTWHIRKCLGFTKSINNDPLYYAKDLLIGDIRSLFSGKIFKIEKIS